MPTLLILIVAYAENRVMGRHNGLPWKLSEDLAHFKRVTMDHPIIMGRKTWQSLGRALPGRMNIVISRNSLLQAPGAHVVTGLADALKICPPDTAAFVIGGAQIYAHALPYVHRILATEIQTPVQGDVYFPKLIASEWKEVARTRQPKENNYEYDFVIYERQKEKNNF